MHFGIVVDDLHRTMEFYRQVFGYEVSGPYSYPTVPAYFELPGDTLDYEVAVAAKDGRYLTLIKFNTPGTTGHPERRPFTEVPQIYLCYSVDDVDSVAALVTEFGGTVMESTRIHIGEPARPVLMCADPNGIRFELQQRAPELATAGGQPE